MTQNTSGNLEFNGNRYSSEHHQLLGPQASFSDDNIFKATGSSLSLRHVHKHRPWHLSFALLIILCTVFITCIVTIPTAIHVNNTYFPSTQSSQDSKYGGLLAPAGTIQQVWQHDLTFSQSPTKESEEAWDALVPVGRGFIHQPEIAPFISNIAAFHQLHCLHAIMVAYYAALNSSDSENMELYGTRIATHHIRHCFDYLRRGIMCAADTNLEVVDRVNRTTNGWGQPKVCRDWDAVFRYAERWANSTDKTIVT